MGNTQRLFEPISGIELEQQIKDSSNKLFESVKRSPTSARKNLPNILKTNQFETTALVTKSIAYLDIERKSIARKTTRRDRLKKYKRIFTSQPNDNAIFHYSSSEYSGVTNSSFKVTDPLIVVTGNCSLFFSDLTVTREDLSFKPERVDLLFVVSFDNELRREYVWKEFDSIIRDFLAMQPIK